MITKTSSRGMASLFALIGLVGLLTNTAVQADETGRGSDPDLVRAIDALLAAPALQMGFQGVFVQSLADGTTLYERNSDRVFLPASNNKLLTSGAALAVLGADFYYRTLLLHSGEITEEGILEGDLILRGEGDPLLTVTDLDALAKQARDAGIRRVTGSLLYDASYFDREALGVGWEWDDEPFYYSAQISALNLEENLVTVNTKPGRKIGQRVRVNVEPTAKYLRVVNTATTGAAKSASTLHISRVRGENVLVVSGSLPLDAVEKDNPPVALTMEDPARFCATVMAERLRKAGIAIGGVREIKLPVRSTTAVAEHDSSPLSALLKLLNKPSDNLMAECLLKTIGAVKGKVGSAEEGAAAARAWFTTIGMDVSRVEQADGSGLSRMNFVSPRNLVTLLAYYSRQPGFAIFYDSLPIAGVDGTLRRRMKGTPAENNCHGKTGTLSHASSLSGYVKTADGEMLAFSMLMNNHLAGSSACTTVQDKITTLLASYKRKREGDLR